MTEYSDTERRLLGLLPRGGRPISSKELADRLYRGRDDPPFNPRSSVVAIMASLIRKTEANGEGFRICKTKRSGPYPVSYRKEKR